MNEETVTPKYATLLYEVRKQLDISWLEYVYLDMVYHLSHDGWCWKSQDNIGVDLGLDRSNVWRMKKRLVERGLIKEGKNGQTKTTELYQKALLTVDNSPSSMLQNATMGVAKRNNGVVKTQHKNNNRITFRNNVVKKFNKYGQETESSVRARVGIPVSVRF